jgi:hypothetical protein
VSGTIVTISSKVPPGTFNGPRHWPFNTIGVPAIDGRLNRIRQKRKKVLRFFFIKFYKILLGIAIEAIWKRKLPN